MGCNYSPMPYNFTKLGNAWVTTSHEKWCRFITYACTDRSTLSQIHCVKRWPTYCDAIWHHVSWSSLVHVVACRLFGATSISEPTLACCKLDHWEQISVKFDSKYHNFHTSKCIWQYRLQNVGHFLPASPCYNAPVINHVAVGRCSQHGRHGDRSFLDTFVVFRKLNIVF